MRVLFISSGNSSKFDITPFIKAQGDSLERKGVEVIYFQVVGRGIRGYLKAIPKLRAFLKEKPVDIIHAHYMLCGWVAVLARPRLPIVLSLMGNDALGDTIGPGKVDFFSRYLTLLTWLIQPFVQAVISKAAHIEKYVYRKQISYIIPNGINLEQFNCQNSDGRADLGLDAHKQYVLFLGNPVDVLKNYTLVESTMPYIRQKNVELINPYPIAHDMVPKYINAVDVLALCSFREGSPNVIKEAMACNCPIVSTKVGDAAWVMEDTPGCYLAGFEPEAFARQLEKALDFSRQFGRTQGRDRIINLGLEAAAVAEKISLIYQNLLEKQETVSHPLS